MFPKTSQLEIQTLVEKFIFPPEHQKMLYNRFYNPCIQSHLDVFSVPFSINKFDFVYFQFLIIGCSAAVSSTLETFPTLASDLICRIYFRSP